MVGCSRRIRRYTLSLPQTAGGKVRWPADGTPPVPRSPGTRKVSSLTVPHPVRTEPKYEETFHRQIVVEQHVRQLRRCISRYRRHFRDDRGHRHARPQKHGPPGRTDSDSPYRQRHHATGSDMRRDAGDRQSVPFRLRTASRPPGGDKPRHHRPAALLDDAAPGSC